MVRFLPLLIVGLLSVGWQSSFVAGHDHSRQRAEKKEQAAGERAAAAAEPPAAPDQPGTCQLTFRLLDSANLQPLGGLVRLTNIATGKHLSLAAEIHRERNWYAVPSTTIVTVPATRLRLEAFHGLDTELVVEEVDLTGQVTSTLELKLPRYYDPSSRGLRSGNTHLHLMKLTYLEALRYLQVVPAADGLDLVFLSHLRRIPDERNYVSNQIVENSFAGGELQRLSQHGVLFANGEEHRHNFGRGGEGYGHVMLLELARLIHPVSIGPGIMGEGTDGRPLQTGIREARAEGATVIWCHNTFGLEDLPNWMAGLLHAQNIFDGGEHGSYQDTYYRYLNLGLRVPFSSGTDWFIYDFSRVYVPVAGELSSRRWLQSLQDEQSYITNGTFLEFTVNDQPIGATLQLAAPGPVTIRARGLGRNNFRALELIHNGRVVDSVPAKPDGGHFTANLQIDYPVDEPGWLAVRIPLEAGQNEFDRPLFAHTSAIHVDVAGKRIFRPAVARELLAEMRQGQERIREQGKFATDEERETVLAVHHRGIALLEQRLAAAEQR